MALAEEFNVDKWAQVNNIKLHYLDYEGNSPALVLMPGLTGNAYTFEGLIKAGLSPHFRVIAPDLRGRGLSDKPESGYSMADHAADIIGLLDALGLEKVVLGGHSFGGLLSLYMSAHYPNRISKLIIIDAAGSLHPAVRELIQPGINRLGKVMPSWFTYLETMKEMPYYQGWWDSTIESYYRADVQIGEDGTVKPRSRPEAIIEAIDKALTEDWAHHIKAITHPLLLLNALGAYGLPGTPPLLPKAQALETVNAVADGHYVEIYGNHMTMLFSVGAHQIVKAIQEFV
ncbi:MAG: alpha/beta hydrolase [Pseudomonadota bacterium]